MDTEHAGKRLPRPSVVTAAWWEASRRHQLLLQRCRQCEHTQFYPRTICTSCMSGELEWIQSGGTGRIRSYTVVRHPVSKAYADEVPYVIALVQLDEGPTMMSTVCNCDPETIRSGMQVEVVFEQWTEEITIPKFQLAAAD